MNEDKERNTRRALHLETEIGGKLSAIIYYSCQPVNIESI